MTQEEHLNKIVAKCRELLIAAERRTPGKWQVSKTHLPTVVSSGEYVAKAVIPLNHVYPTAEQYDTRDANAVFIANCAGPAEAGWRATIAAIEAIPMMSGGFTQYELAREIIAAWPEELL